MDYKLPQKIYCSVKSLCFAFCIIFFTHASANANAIIECNYGKIFMGNSGTFFISFLLGILFIYSYKNKIISVEEIILLMFLPGIDMIRLFIIRILNKKSPFSGDLNHIHHLIYLTLKSKIKFILIPFLFLWPFLSFKLFNNFMLSMVISLLAYLILINIKNLVLFFYTK